MARAISYRDTPIRSGAEASQGNHVLAVADLTRELGDADDDGDELWRSSAGRRIRRELALEPAEVVQPLVDLILRELDLECGPSAVGKLDDGVGLQPGVVAVVEQGNGRDVRERRRVRPQVADGEVLEYEAKGLPVTDQGVGPMPSSATAKEGSAR